MTPRISGLLRRAAIAVIRLYQVGLSPLTGGTCRFVPTCSAYAAEAIDRYGVLKGSWLSARRVARCHPFGRYGFDPVPDASSER
jgi:putative membrane protein insertion efficiency factor